MNQDYGNNEEQDIDPPPLEPNDIHQEPEVFNENLHDIAPLQTLQEHPEPDLTLPPVLIEPEVLDQGASASRRSTRARN